MFRRFNYFVLGLVGSSFISAITVPFLAWFYTPDSIGRFSFFLLTVSFAVQIGTLGLEQGYVREYHAAKNRVRLLSETVAPSFIIISLLFLSFGVLSLFDEVAEIVISEPVAFLGLLIFLAYAFAIAQRFATVSYRVRSLGAKFCFVLVSAKVVFLLCAYFAYLFSWQESTALYGSYLVSLVVPLVGLGGGAIFLFFKSSGFASLDLSRIGFFNWPLLRYCVPLLFGALAFWGVKFSGHIGLRYYEDFNELAFYSVGVSVAAGLNLFSSIFNTMWFPFFFKADADGKSKEALRIGLDLTLALVIFGSGAAGVLAAVVVHLLPESFSKIQFFLPVLALSSLLYTLSEVTGSGIALSRQTRYGLYAGVVGSVCAVLTALLFCKDYGAAGAAYAYAVGHVVFFACRTEFGRRLWLGERTVRSYLVVLLCLLYAGLCTYQEAVKNFVPVFVGSGLMLIAIPMLARAVSQLRRFRVALR